MVYSRFHRGRALNVDIDFEQSGAIQDFMRVRTRRKRCSGYAMQLLGIVHQRSSLYCMVMLCYALEVVVV